MKGWLVVLLSLVVILSALAITNINLAEEILSWDIPQIRFVAPTPLNNSYNSLPVIVNYTATDSNLQSVFLDFNKSLVLWLRMNNGSDESNTLVKDWSSLSNNGTALNGANLTASGKLGSAYIFGGGDEYINVTNRPEYSPANYNLTIALWIKPFNFDFVADDINEKNAVHFLTKGNNNEYEWYFRIYNRTAVDGVSLAKRIAFYGFNATGGLGVGSYFQDNLTENEWIFVTALINKTSTLIYKNGILRDLDYHNLNLTYQPSPVRVGRNRDNTAPTSSFNGSIDEVMVFNRELSSNEILMLYNATGPFVISYNLSNGNYTLRAFALDLDGNLNSTEEVTFDVGDANNDTIENTTGIYPIVLLISPANNTLSAIRAVSFLCNLSGNNISNVSLYTSTNGSWSANATQFISGTSNQSNITVYGIADGTYLWNCLVKDESNNQSFNNTNNTITIDTTIPSSVSLSAPAEGYSSTSTMVEFNFSATDNQDTNLTCNITVDNSVAISTSILNGTFKTASIPASISSHQWNVTCYDNVLNSNFSSTQNFTITSKAITFPGTGGSNGGGGGSTKGTQTFVYSNLTQGDTIEVNLTNDNTPFTNSWIVLANSVSQATISVKSVTGVPPFDKTGKVIYKFIEAKTNLLPSDILSVKLKFRVENSWLKSKNIRTGDILLYRYSSGWNALPTYFLSKDSSYSYYESRSQGFSYFTIVGKKLDSNQLARASTEQLAMYDDTPQNLQVTGSAIKDIAIISNNEINEDKPKDLLTTSLLIVAVITTIIYGLLLEALLKKKVLS